MPVIYCQLDLDFAIHSLLLRAARRATLCVYLCECAPYRSGTNIMNRIQVIFFFKVRFTFEQTNSVVWGLYLSIVFW